MRKWKNSPSVHRGVPWNHPTRPSLGMVRPHKVSVAVTSMPKGCKPKAQVSSGSPQRVGLVAGFVVERILEDGRPADVIVRIAARVQADLIVVGRRGLGQAPRLLGSTSEAALAHARIPVVVVPDLVER